jgi:hypothetical protein
LLSSPEVEAVVEKKLAELGNRPEGAMFAMMVNEKKCFFFDSKGYESCYAEANDNALCGWNGYRVNTSGWSSRSFKTN